MIVDEIDYDKSSVDANKIFKKITENAISIMSFSN